MGSMGKGGLYSRWVEKYGEEIANIKMEEYRSKMSNSVSGENNPFYGKTHTKETREKLKQFSTGKPAWNKGIPNFEIRGDRNPAKNCETRKKISEGVSSSYNESLRKIRSIHFKSIDREKIRETNEKNGFWRKKSDMSDFERYRNEVRKLSDKSYLNYVDIVDPEKRRGRKFHLDHILSIAKGFDSKVDPKIISHPCNLRIVHHSLNESKHIRCDITLNQLMEKINEFEN